MGEIVSPRGLASKWRAPRVVTVEAPAKINLHLEVFGTRPDGYHEIRSVFQMISLADQLCLSVFGNDGECRVNDDFGVSETDNLIAHTVRSFCDRTGIRSGVTVQVLKRIPLGAGLGGGSSDAAATLRGLEWLFRRNLGGGERQDIALRVGSDVPFFLGSGASIVQGRGERQRSLQMRGDFEVVVVYPGICVSTREAFEWLDGEAQEGMRLSLSARELENAYRREPFHQWPFWNSFEGVVAKRHPLIAGIGERLSACGADFVSLSGSGSAVFGVFREHGTAAEARNVLSRSYSFVDLARPLAREPFVRLE